MVQHPAHSDGFGQAELHGELLRAGLLADRDDREAGLRDQAAPQDRRAGEGFEPAARQSAANDLC